MGLLDAFKQYWRDASPGGVLNPEIPKDTPILGLLADPIGSMKSTISGSNEKAKQHLALLSAATADARRTGKLFGSPAQDAYQNDMSEFVVNNVGPLMFIGKGAKTWSQAAADRALQMQKEGKSAREIWPATGTWVDAPDGMLRQEISDSKSYIKGQDGTVLGALKYGNTPDKVMSHPLLEKAYAMDSVRIGSPEGMSSRGSMSLVEVKPSLDDLLNADELLSVKPKRISEINVSRNSPDQRSTLLHELQHEIQKREGFARGGNTEQFNNGLPYADLVKSSSRNQDALIRAREAGGIDPVTGLSEKTLRENVDGISKQIANWKDPYEQYRRLAGEAEARATQARMNLTPEQRLATFPADSYDVPMDQLIVRKGLLGEPQMVADPLKKAPFKGLLGGNPESVKVGTVNDWQKGRIVKEGRYPMPDNNDVHATQDTAQHLLKRKAEKFNGNDLWDVLVNSLRNDAKVASPNFELNRMYPSLVKKGAFDPVSGRNYAATLPVAVEDGKIVIKTIVPDGIPFRKKKTTWP